jgi:hypothetical protein
MAHATDQARREERFKSSQAADGLAPSELRSTRQAYQQNHPGERRVMKSLFAPLARFIGALGHHHRSGDARSPVARRKVSRTL